MIKKSFNLGYDIDKIINKHRFLINKYFNNDYQKELTFYIEKYNEYKYISDIKTNIFKNNIITFGYYDLYQLYKDDYLIFNNIQNNLNKIAEISVLPTMFEILSLDKKIYIDVYLTKNNYLNLDENEWMKAIDIYKKKIKANIFYNKKITKKYDILIINLIKNIKSFTKNYDNDCINFIKKDLYKSLKKSIKNLKYLEKGGTCYIYFYSIFTDNKDLLKLYLDLCKKFENINFFIPKYRNNHKKYGGLWLKCYNYKSNYKSEYKSNYKSNIDIFYKKYYNKKYQWYLNYEKFLEKYFNKDKNYLKLNYEIAEIQVNTCKNFIEEYDIEIKNEWKSFLYGDFYVNQSYKPML